MAHWKAARLVFFGSATDGLPLKGRLVRNRGVVAATAPDARAGEPRELDIPAGSQGIVVEESRQHVTIAYARQPGRRALRLEALARASDFRLLRISWTAFKEHLDIECWIDAEGQEVMTGAGPRPLAA